MTKLKITILTLLCVSLILTTTIAVLTTIRYDVHVVLWFSRIALLNSQIVILLILKISYHESI